MRELFASIVRKANKKLKADAMEGGFDIMKQLVNKTRTKKKKNQNKQYYTDGYNIMRKWQRKDTGRLFKKTVPIKEDFSIMRQIQEHPVPIKKEKKKSLMEPIEVDYPPTMNVQRIN